MYYLYGSATTYLVTDAADSGTNTSRQAIINANTLMGKDTIEVNAGLDTIFLSTYCHVLFKDCTFTENQAPNTGGTVLNNSNGAIMPFDSTVVDFQNCTFDQNSSGADGGALYIKVTYVLIDNSCFTGNMSGGTGTRIFNNQGILTLTRGIKFDGPVPHIVNGIKGETVLGSSFSIPLGVEFLIE